MLTLDGLVIERGDLRLEASGAFTAPLVGLVGASGAGKTTLMHAIAGLIRPSVGRICIDDTVVFDAKEGVDLPCHVRRVGLVFQDMRLFPHLDVKENLCFSPGAGPAMLDDVVSVLDLGGLLRRRPGSLSGGEARRVAIGRMLMSKPSCLLLDEPMTGLHEALAERVLGYIVRVREHFEIPALLCSHDLRTLLTVTDVVAVIRNGKLNEPRAWDAHSQEDQRAMSPAAT